MRIRREEVLPVFEKLGDVRSRAITLGKIADILVNEGQLDEAMRIRRQEELPVFEKLGDVRERAITLGQIADILAKKGQLDEAMRIRREEELPVYEKLGDVRSRAVTLGKIADILVKKGQLDEAMRIRRQEVLPVYEKLGDVRSRAVTLGKIADILVKKGQLDEAMRIRREEVLPVSKKLGDQEGIAHTLFNMVQIRLIQGNQTPEQTRENLPDLASAFAINLKMGRADGIAAIGSVYGYLLEKTGQYQEARSVLDQAVAAAEKLGWTEETRKMSALIENWRKKPTRNNGSGPVCFRPAPPPPGCGPAGHPPRPGWRRWKYPSNNR